MTFSIRRTDLYDSNKPKTLSLRRAGVGVDDRPIFNLRLETAKMRTATGPTQKVSGVSYDDFVFQIVPPDYGDAAIAPTLMNAEKGARHENGNLEPEDGRPLAPFAAGQYLPVSLSLSGQEHAVERTYSLSNSPHDEHYRISVKRERQGLVSRYLHDELRVGDVIRAGRPGGIGARGARPEIDLRKPAFHQARLPSGPRFIRDFQ